MRTPRRLVGMLLLVLLLVPIGVNARDGTTTSSGAYVAPSVLAEVREEGATTAWIVLRSKADLKRASRIEDWSERGQFVYDQLTKTAENTQKGLRKRLEQRGVAYESFWIVNSIKVTVDEAEIDDLARQPEVEQILPTQIYQLPEPELAQGAAGATVQNVEWGVDRINAPDVWSNYGVRGEGIVVASIDTGVRFDHPALAAQYRGNLGNGNFDHNYNWFNPTSRCSDPQIPCDNTDHGTHVTGTMVGDDDGANQIGVAPGATWIAAKGCPTIDCSANAVLASGQWLLAPTDLNGENPRPDLRPHIINNSWTGNSGDPFYQGIVNAWIASGIFPMFAIGNTGPSCNSAGSPGDYVASYSAGAFNINNNIAGFSSRGASAFGGEVKPNIAAPGVNIRSSVRSGGYAALNGTSMASPHVAGAVALIWSAVPDLVGNIDATRAVLDGSAIDKENLQCGGTGADNNVAGEGLLDVFAAVNLSQGPRGVLQGAVTDVAGDPISGVTVELVGPTTRTVQTYAAGEYESTVLAGTYDVTVSLFGYGSQTASGVEVADGGTTIQDFILEEELPYPVSGTVLDAFGEPVPNATIKILGAAFPPATTDGNGIYTLPDVPAGTHTLQATGNGCLVPQSQTLVVDGSETLDFDLPYRIDDFGHSCQIVADNYVEAETVLPLDGDDESAAVELPFPFPFYGQTYTTAYVATNGFLNFLSPNTELTNTRLPNTAAPNAAIYPFWEDLVVSESSSSVRTELLGTAPLRAFVIEWRNVRIFPTAQRLDFEVVLHEDGDIFMHYRDIGPTGHEQGNSATLGIENESGTDALQYSFNSRSVSDGLAIHYFAPDPPPPNQPPQVATGGPYTGNEGSPISLNGTASDPDDDPLTSAWTLSDGAPCTFDDPAALATTLTCANDGDFSVTLTVDDGEHDPVSETATVTVSNVTPIVETPVINSSPSDEGENVTVNAAFSDPGTDDAHACAVDWGEGPSSDGSIADGVCQASHTYTDDNPSGTSSDDYTVTVTITDDDDDGANDVIHTVRNLPPAIEEITTNAPVPAGEPATLTVSATDPGVDDILTYAFDCNNDGDYETPGAGNQGSCPIPDGVESLTIGIQVLDDDLGQATAVVEVTGPLYLCVNQYTGALTPQPGQGCPTGTTELGLPPVDPVTLCVSSYTGAIRSSPSGVCSDGFWTHIVPDDGPLAYCQSVYTGDMRFSSNGECNGNEIPGAIPGRNTVE